MASRPRRQRRKCTDCGKQLGGTRPTCYDCGGTKNGGPRIGTVAEELKASITGVLVDA